MNSSQAHDVDIKKHEIELGQANERECFVAVLGLVDLEALSHKRGVHHAANLRIIVDHEYVSLLHAARLRAVAGPQRSHPASVEVRLRSLRKA